MAQQPEEATKYKIICKLPMKEVTIGVDDFASLPVGSLKAKLEAKSGALGSCMKIDVAGNEVQDDQITLSQAGYSNGEIVAVHLEDPLIEMVSSCPPTTIALPPPPRTHARAHEPHGSHATLHRSSCACR